MKMFVNLCVLGLAFLANVGASPEAELKEGRDRRIVQLRWYILKIFCVQDASQDCTQMELKEENF